MIHRFAFLAAKGAEVTSAKTMFDVTIHHLASSKQAQPYEEPALIWCSRLPKFFHSQDGGFPGEHGFIG
jgi:hypothetical protein